MIDNKAIVKPLMTFPKPGDSFYFVQVLQRKKDHQGVRLGGSNNNSRLIKAYYITDIDKLEVYWEEITKLCNLFDARAGINLNPRSLEKAAFDLNIKIANQMKNRDWYGMRKAWDSVCGDYHAEMDKRWLIDIDTQEPETVMGIRETILQIQDDDSMKGSKKNYGILAIVPSKSGVHLITHPFNLKRFNELYPDIEVHKNNPTNLYIP